MSLLHTNTFAPAPKSIFQSGQYPLSKGDRITVVGAGAFGGWSALSLLRKGFKVTLVDAWGPGNSRSSSGDETRVIRSTYGNNAFYFDLNVRALTLWKENQQRWGKEVFHNTGVIWFCYEEKAPLVDESIPFARKHKMEYEYLSVDEVHKRYPAIYTGDLHHAWFDPYGGYLKARESCLAVWQSFLAEGGQFIQAYAQPGKPQAGRLHEVTLSSGEVLRSAAYLFACGPWMGKLFPEVLGETIRCTKQEVYYFGVPKELALQYDRLPAWIDLDGKDFYYGIPGNNGRGFKIGVDKRGEAFDPTHGERISTTKVLADARQFIEHRYPGLKGMPVVESRVCPYENSPDGNFVFQPHPEAGNLWFLGGGSGHGFKHGPAIGELVANQFGG